MMDRFNFRIWWKKENRYRVDTHIIPVGHLTDFANSDEYVVEQCTGLKDKNGKLIFEGDVVLFNDDDYPWQIKWNEVFVRWVLYSPLGSNEDGEEELTNTDAEYLEIIGNIHEQKDVK